MGFLSGDSFKDSLFSGLRDGLGVMADDNYFANKMKREEMARQNEALLEMASQISKTNPEMAPIATAAAKTGSGDTLLKLALRAQGIGIDQPANVQEWEYYNNLSPADQEKYLLMKRSNPFVDLGGSMMRPSPTTGAPLVSYARTLRPEDTPYNAAAKTNAAEIGTNYGADGRIVDPRIFQPDGTMQEEGATPVGTNLINLSNSAGQNTTPSALSGLARLAGAFFGAPSQGLSTPDSYDNIDQRGNPYSPMADPVMTNPPILQGDTQAAQSIPSAADVAAAKKTAEAQAQANVDAGVLLSKTEENTNNAIDIIDQLVDPNTKKMRDGVDAVFGGLGGMQGRQAAILPVTEAQRKYQPFVEQIKGKAFLTAFETLKGGGQITEVEGIKATQAISRVQNYSEPEDAAQAMLELRNIAWNGRERARRQADQNYKMNLVNISTGEPQSGVKQPAGGSTPPKRLVYDPATGDFK